MTRPNRESPRLRCSRRLFRLMGVFFAAAGGSLAGFGAWMLLHPDSRIIVNGVPTTAVSPKLFYTAFGLAFLVLGLVLCFGSWNIVYTLAFRHPLELLDKWLKR